ncbi:RNA methyltransferase [Candidatus Woesearchaeota archaeon]|jgi:tRNA/rRNA methyltransferase|nr:RNA methyltransferase [Candidatus Woesearchaeota archaeon]MBT6520115.1 RNA methyltransferase [Candidatus Woesearchaeota archaeon]MBT7366720.1 RNA methyltransferase [Candidatus Woesearchaeota archaeon]
MTISVILIEPKNSGNVGAIARVMKNFGFYNLILVNPKCNHLCQTARNRAKYAQEVLTKAKVRTFRILNQFDYRIATTARLGTDYNVTRSPITPESLGTKFRELNLNNSKIALIIGRESIGLKNDELELCDFTVSIPSDPTYPTLNISHSVGIILYELKKQLDKPKLGDNIRPVTKAELKQMNKMMNQIIKLLHFTTKDKITTQKKVWKKLFTKSFLSKRESFALMGMFNKLISDLEKIKIKKKK